MSTLTYDSARMLQPKLRLAIQMAIAVVSIGSAGATWSESAVYDYKLQQYKLEIARKPLAAALGEFSAKTGVTISVIATPAEVRGLLVGPLMGSYTFESALDSLVASSGLTYVWMSERSVAVMMQKSQPTFQQTRLDMAPPHSAEASSEASSSDGVAREKTSTRRAAQIGVVEEVIVSAQKREQSLQDVPIAITVLGGPQLDRSTAQGLTEALTRVPGVGINETYQGGGTQVAVRGVTAGGALFNGASPVSYYLDSVPFGLVRQAVGPDLNTYDLERVEVLRGPQGTLYGANSQNGVVRVLTHNADLSELSFKARTSAASTEDGDESYRGDLAVNVPMIEGKLAARAVAGYQRTGGWIDRPNEKDANDAEISNVRLKVNAQPTDDLSIGLSAWRSRSDYGGPSIADDSGWHSALNDEPISTDFETYGLKVGYDFQRFTVTSMTSYLEYFNSGFLDTSVLIPGRISETTLDADVFAQELLLSSTAQGPWRWTLGGMYRDAQDRQYQENRRDGTLLGFPGEQVYVSKSSAVFGEITRVLFDGRIELTAGLRYFEDEVTGIETARVTGAPPSQLVRTVDNFDALSPRAVLTWHPSGNSTIYASYSEGFRSGVSQNGAVPFVNGFPYPPAEPDTLHNYEIGAKGSLADGLITYDAAVYYIDWQDVQQSLTVPVSPGNVLLVTAIINAESASGMGFDFGLAAHPLEGLQLGLNLSANDLTMDDDVMSSNLVLYEKGDRLNISPELTVGAFVDYEVPLGGEGMLGHVGVSSSYTSEMDLRTISFGAQRIAQGDPIFITNLSLGVEAPGGWTASLFVNNLANEQGSPVRFPFHPLVTDWNAHVRPRTVGLQLEMTF